MPASVTKGKKVSTNAISVADTPAPTTQNVNVNNVDIAP